MSHTQFEFDVTQSCPYLNYLEGHVGVAKCATYFEYLVPTCSMSSKHVLRHGFLVGVPNLLHIITIILIFYVVLCMYIVEKCAMFAAFVMVVIMRGFSGLPTMGTNPWPPTANP